MIQNVAGAQTVFVGTVTWFDTEKGFGYIQQKSGPIIYAQFCDVIATGFKTLTVGQKVEFTVTQSERGQTAKNIAPC